MAPTVKAEQQYKLISARLYFLGVLSCSSVLIDVVIEVYYVKIY